MQTEQDLDMNIRDIQRRNGSMDALSNRTQVRFCIAIEDPDGELNMDKRKVDSEAETGKGANRSNSGKIGGASIRLPIESPSGIQTEMVLYGIHRSKRTE